MHKFFTISERIPRTPPAYKLKDDDGEIIDGCFNEEELPTIKVDKILERGQWVKMIMAWLAFTIQLKGELQVVLIKFQ